MDDLGAPVRPPPEVATYGRRLAEALAACSGQRLVGAYVHGSAVLGGWLASRSDVDLLVVLEDAVPAKALAEVEKVLVGNASACPGTGLECSVVAEAQARRPAPPWPFLLHVQSSPGEQVKVVRGADLAGDTDLLMHYAACREAGVAVSGLDPLHLFGVVPRATILTYLADELAWGLAHGSEAYAVLNACRALVYRDSSHLVSKVSGGRTALDSGLGPTGVIARALDQQQGRTPPAAVAPDASAFVRAAAEALRSAD
jgi:Domain of unknown function (DUF4111)/Nucleotidyltransferase domain